jgi:hypothetical protein
MTSSQYCAGPSAKASRTGCEKKATIEGGRVEGGNPPQGGRGGGGVIYSAPGSRQTRKSSPLPCAWGMERNRSIYPSFTAVTWIP